MPNSHSHSKNHRGKSSRNKNSNKNMSSALSGLPSTVARDIRKDPHADVRSERLPRDGQTFTALTAIPRTRPPPPMVYSISQEYSLKDYITTSTVTPTNASIAFVLSNVDQYTSLTAVFDQYMIPELEFWLIPNNSTAANSAGVDGLLSTVLDFDDGNYLTSFSQYGDYSNVVTTGVCSGHYRHFTPHVAIAASSGGAFTAYANDSLQWVDCASPSVTHFGVKVGATSTSSVVTYDVVLRARILFKSVR